MNYTVGIIARGRGYRKIRIRNTTRAAVRASAKRWLEVGSKVGIFANAAEEAAWLKKQGY
jgi:hypothetical protein